MLALAGCGYSAVLPAAEIRGAVFAPAALVEPHVPKVAAFDATAATSVTLGQLLAHADVHAPSLAVARSEIGIAEAELVGARPTLPSNPEVEVVLGGRTVDGTTGFESEIGIQQEVELGGQRGLRIGAAKAQRASAEARVNSARWRVHVLIHRLFLELMSVEEQQRQAEVMVDFSQTVSATVRRQVEAGETARMSLLVAESDLAQTREAVIGLKRRHLALRIRLAGLSGWPGERVPAPSGALPAVRRAPGAGELLKRMKGHHPDFRVRELAVLAARAHVRVEDTLGQVKPTFGVRYAREAAPGPEPEAHVWTFSASVPIPLWQTNQGGKARAKAVLRRVDRLRAAAAARLRSQLLEAAAALDAAAARVALFENTVVPPIQQSLKLLERAYAAGEIDIHQVSQTRERVLLAAERHLAAREAYFRASAVLEGLVGAEVWE